ncbi:MAG: hypothetical protein RL154_432 [Pseudomonadota bacterium]
MSNNWNNGYITDINYTFGYYEELNPLRIKIAFLNNNIAFPEIGNACELGFGQGLSSSIHACASVVNWYGTDFNSAQTLFATDLVKVAASNAKFYDDSFAEFCNRDDLPNFDYIALHGIWSWISPENQSIIVDFIRRKLNVGGVLYISYNTQPGWAPMVPMRELMAQYYSVYSQKSKTVVERIDDSLDFIDKLFATDPSFVKNNPSIMSKINGIKEQNRNYLAHEYFNKDWHPVSFEKMSELLSSAKLSYVCSANFLDHIDALNLTPEQKELLDGISDINFKQSVRDFILNQQFRKDYWVKGSKKLNAYTQFECFTEQRVILIMPKSDISLKVSCPIGDATMSEAIYLPILDFLSDYKIKSIAQIEQYVSSKGIDYSKLIEVIIVLLGNKTITAVQSDDAIHKAKKVTDKLNIYLMKFARSSNEIGYLASPVTGGGYPLDRFQQLFLLFYLQGCKTTDALVTNVWQVLATQKQKIVKDGKVLESDRENIADLTLRAEEFLKSYLPIAKALQII